MGSKKWWENAIVYQIYPRSFKDSNGDGIGDIDGIIQKLDYVKSLGVNTIWINPMTLSAQEDNGYDVIDYKKMDPLFGTDEDGDRLIHEIHKREMKVIYDFPLNHTSDQHPWFKEAFKGKDNPYRDYYIWADRDENEPYPNNWTAAFGGSAWSKELNGDQYYLHLFKQSMPDVDWANPQLREEMAEILIYWIDKGIDGFRLDAFIYLDIDKDFPNHPDEFGEGQDMNENGDNIQSYLSEMNEAIHNQEKEIFIVGEATSADIETTNWYTEPNRNIVDKIITMVYFPEQEELLDDSVSDSMQHLPIDFKAFKEVQKEFQEGQKDTGGPILFWSNHDLPRAPHIYGDMEEHRDNTAKMMAAMLYLQKGIPIIYYGEEIGMKNVAYDDPANVEDAGTMDFYKEAKEAGWDHKKIMHHINHSGRDVARGIMQWDDSEKVDFTEGNPWTLYNQEEKYNVKDQEKDENSILHFYRKLLEIKKEALFQEGSYEMVETEEVIYAYKRKLENQEALVCSNFSDKNVSVDLNNEWTKEQIILENEGNTIQGNSLHLAPYGTVVFRKK
ncbi:MAG TPA: alpha-amylase family glycosyl hydrolase [Atopostipes sp.]|nr:alpha-amylase family glycosyl hydrolase [Atopostipes sp.]